MKYRSILEFGLNNWYNWLVETKKNESIKWYTRVFSRTPGNVKKKFKKSNDFNAFPKTEEDVKSKNEPDSIKFIKIYYRLDKENNIIKDKILQETRSFFENAKDYYYQLIKSKSVFDVNDLQFESNGYIYKNSSLARVIMNFAHISKN